jgi:membrane protein implicated in regulation of membrane protease activity
MGNKADLRRRWVGAVFLIVSILMIIAGETILSERLRQRPSLLFIYWSLCFASVLAAVLVALLDLMILRRRLRAEQRGLLKQTIDKIAEEKKSRDNGSRNGNRSR